MELPMWQNAEVSLKHVLIQTRVARRDLILEFREWEEQRVGLRMRATTLRILDSLIILENCPLYDLHGTGA